MRYRVLLPTVLALLTGAGPATSLPPPPAVIGVGGKLELELRVTDDAMFVDLANMSDQAVKVNKRLLYGPEVGWNDLVFTIRDAQGRKMDYLAKATSGPTDAADWCFLLPRDFVGQSIELWRIKMEYGLAAGTYSVSAQYLIRSEGGEIVSRLRSPVVSMKISQ